MALSLRRHRIESTPRQREQLQSVAEVVGQLQQLATALGNEVDRLEGVNDAAQDRVKEGQ